MNRVRYAASLQNDTVHRRLEQIGKDTDFSYHMTNKCYKKYTLQKTLDQFAKPKSEVSINDQSKPRMSSRSSDEKRDPPNVECSYFIKCIICNCQKKCGINKKYRISEDTRAGKFLEAVVHNQDGVYTRVCDLQDEMSVFAADLYYHANCLTKYF